MTSRAAASLALLPLLAVSPAAPGRADEAADIELGRTLFTSVTPACAICHTLQAAEATGTVGPSLDELKPDAARVATALREGLNAMPSYAETLTEAQIVALARFVSSAVGATP